MNTSDTPDNPGTRDTPDTGDTPEFDDLTAAILRRTTGATSICERIGDRLCAWVDGGLSGIDSELVAGHVEHCAECRSIATALRELAGDLPLLAEVEPDVRFVVDVLDRTSRRKVEGRDMAALLERAWARLIYRPRIAQEIAYCAAMVLMLIIGNQAREGHGLPREGSAISARAAGEFTRAADLISKLTLRVEAGIASGDHLGGDRLAIPIERRPMSAGIRRTTVRLGRTLDLAWACGRSVGVGLLHLDSIAIWSAIHDFRDGVRKCWKETKEATEPSDLSARIRPQTRQSMDSHSGAGPGDGDAIARGGEDHVAARDTGADKQGDGGHTDDGIAR